MSGEKNQSPQEDVKKLSELERSGLGTGQKQVFQQYVQQNLQFKQILYNLQANTTQVTGDD